MKQTIQLNVNREGWKIAVEPNDILLDVLRDMMGIKSPKIGCERGECGACTILLNGRTVRSCMILAIEADGCDIVTVEGLTADGLPSLMRAFVVHNSFQCGFCAPGVVLTADELLERQPEPSEHEVRQALAGHLCRCTGYEAMVAAVLSESSARQKQDELGRKGQ